MSQFFTQKLWSGSADLHLKSQKCAMPPAAWHESSTSVTAYGWECKENLSQITGCIPQRMRILNWNDRSQNKARQTWTKGAYEPTVGKRCLHKKDFQPTQRQSAYVSEIFYILRVQELLDPFDSDWPVDSSFYAYEIWLVPGGQSPLDLHC